MNSYGGNTFDRISALLAERALALGASGFSLGDTIIPSEVAMDEAGPMAWALILHADTMVRLAGFGPQMTNILPITCVVNPDSPFGNQAITQSGLLPMSMAINFLDTALEHAICLGMREYNYTPAEWFSLPVEQRITPIEPYFQDLQQNWITDIADSGTLAEQINAWPILLDQERLTTLMKNSAQSPFSRAINFPSMR